MLMDGSFKNVIRGGGWKEAEWVVCKNLLFIPSNGIWMSNDGFTDDPLNPSNWLIALAAIERKICYKRRHAFMVINLTPYRIFPVIYNLSILF